jgi:hypothetical protein
MKSNEGGLSSMAELAETKPQRYEYSSRLQYKQALGKWRKNWLSKAWRQHHLKKKDQK